MKFAKNKIFYGVLIVTGLIITSTLINLEKLNAGSDTHYFLFQHRVVRETILKYKQFPMWNAWQCGGFYFHGNPRSPTFNPYIILTLLFGEIAGVNFQIIASVILSGIFMYMVLENEKFGYIPSFLGALAYMSSGYLLNRIFSGHIEYVTIYSLLPLIFISARKKSVVGMSVTITAVLLSGAVGLIPYFAVFGGFVWLFETNEIRKVKKNDKLQIKIKFDFSFFKDMALILVLTVFLSAVKLLPILEIISETNYTARLADVLYHRYTPKVLLDNLISSSMGFEGNTQVGAGVLIFGLLGLIISTRKGKYISLLSFSLLILALIMNWVLSNYIILLFRATPLLSVMFNTSRVLYRFSIFIVFSLTFYSAVLLHYASKKFGSAALAIFILYFLLLIPNLLDFKSTIKVEDIEGPSKIYNSFTNIYTAEREHVSVIGNFNKLNCYDVIKTIDGYIATPLNVKEGLIVPEGIDYDFTPNKLIFRGLTDSVILNIEYDKRWKSDDAVILENWGRLQIFPNKPNVTIKYSSIWAKIGALISASTVLGLFYFRKKRIRIKFK